MQQEQASTAGTPSVQTVTKTKSLTKTVVSIAALTLVASIVTGGYAAIGSYSAVVGPDVFKMAGRKSDGGGGKPGGGGGKNTPSLQVSLSNQITNETVIAGSKDHIFTRIILDASALAEYTLVNEINFTVTTSGGVSPSEVTNLRLYDPDVYNCDQDVCEPLLKTSNDPDAEASGSISDGDSANVKFTFIDPVLVPKGNTKILELKGDIVTTADGVYQIGIQALPKKLKTKVVDAVTVDSNTMEIGEEVNISYQYGPGPEMTFISSGNLTITRDSSSPKAGLIPASTSGVNVGVFRAIAQHEDVNIEKLYLTGVAANSGGWDQVESLYIYDGATLIANVAPTTTDGIDKIVLVDITNNPIVIPKDASKRLTIKVDTASSNYRFGSNGASGQGLSIKIAAADDVTAKGAQSGNTISNSDVSNASTTAQYLFRSVPTVTPNDDHASRITGGYLSNQTNVPLYRFSVSASSAGPVALYQAGFVITTSTATTTNLVLTDGSSSVGASAVPDKHITDGEGSDTMGVFIKLTSDGAVPNPGSTNVEPYVISAGSTTSFTLRGDLECSSLNCSASNGSTGGAVLIQLLGDTALPNTMPNSATALDNDLYENSFIWGDLWRTPILEVSSTTAISADQWSNGYLVAEADGGKLSPTSTAVIFSR